MAEKIKGCAMVKNYNCVELILMNKFQLILTNSMISFKI